MMAGGQKGKALLNASTTPLHNAAKTGNCDVVKSLLSAGCDVNVQDANGKTPLMLAVESYRKPMAEILLQYGADIHLQDSLGKSALQTVLERSLLDNPCVEMFLNILKNESCNDTENLAAKLIRVRCPLYHVVLLRDVDLTKAVLDKGCAIDPKDCYALKTALHSAVNRRDFANVKLLVERGADVSARDSFQNMPLDYLELSDDSNEIAEILQMFIDRSKSLASCYRRDFMKHVLSYGNPNLLRMFVRCEIDWCARDDLGDTFVNYLIRNSILLTHLDIVEQLRSKKIDINAHDYHYEGNALQMATLLGSIMLVELLLNKGANPNVRSAGTSRPLFIATCFANYNIRIKEYTKIISLLLQYGADPQLTARHGLTIFNNIIVKYNFSVANPIISQLAINEAFGKQTIAYIQDEINSKSDLRDQFALCKVQLNELKLTVIHSSISQFDFLNMSIKTIAVYARNPDFYRKLTSLKICSMNSYYSDTLRRKCHKTLQLIELRKATAGLICKILGISYYSYPIVVDKIIDYVID